MMWKLGSTLLMACFVMCSHAAHATDSIASQSQAAATVSLQDVRISGSVVSGVLVSNSPRLLREVRLLVRYVWLWKTEHGPHHDNPSRTDYYTVPGEIPPGGSLSFTYRPVHPLPKRSDGRFEPTVEIARFTEVGE